MRRGKNKNSNCVGVQGVYTIVKEVSRMFNDDSFQQLSIFFKEQTKELLGDSVSASIQRYRIASKVRFLWSFDEWQYDSDYIFLLLGILVERVMAYIKNKPAEPRFYKNINVYFEYYKKRQRTSMIQVKKDYADFLEELLKPESK